MTIEPEQVRTVHGERVYGVDVDDETRCAHWHTPTDVIALRMKCCGEWFPCYECHEVVADHEARVWPRTERDAKAVLCGVCGTALRIDEYLACGSRCPACSAAFNPGCARHYHLYFDMT